MRLLDQDLEREASEKIENGCEHIIREIAYVFRRKKEVANWPEKIKKILLEAKPPAKTVYQKMTKPDGTVVEQYIPVEVWERHMQSQPEQPKKRKLLALTNG